MLGRLGTIDTVRGKYECFCPKGKYSLTEYIAKTLSTAISFAQSSSGEHENSTHLAKCFRDTKAVFVNRFAAMPRNPPTEPLLANDHCKECHLYSPGKHTSVNKEGSANHTKAAKEINLSADANLSFIIINPI